MKPMKITKTINRKVDDKNYYKFIVTIPNKHLEALGWDDHTSLVMDVEDDQLIIKRT